MTVSYSGRQLTPLEEIELERVRQNEKWGEQNHPDGTAEDWEASCGQGVGWAAVEAEAATRRTDRAAQRGDCTWALILAEEVAEAFAESDPQRLRAELVQVAAVATQWVEAIDRRAPTARRAPVQSSKRAPVDGWTPRPAGTVAWWEHEQAWADYNKRYSNDQDAERIAQRGGFSYWELLDHLGHEPTTWAPRV